MFAIFVALGLQTYKSMCITRRNYINGYLNSKLNVNYSRNKFNKETIQELIDVYISTLKLIGEKCMYKNIKEFTPSDFDAVDITQDDLDALFD